MAKITYCRVTYNSFSLDIPNRTSHFLSSLLVPAETRIHSEKYTKNDLM
jgi:hypothetical protein